MVCVAVGAAFLNNKCNFVHKKLVRANRKRCTVHSHKWTVWYCGDHHYLSRLLYLSVIVRFYPLAAQFFKPSASSIALCGHMDVILRRFMVLVCYCSLIFVNHIFITDNFTSQTLYGQWAACQTLARRSGGSIDSILPVGLMLKCRAAKRRCILLINYL